MEALIFIGIQGAGKSTFYKERFFQSHVRINLDMLRTRRRERLLLAACLEARQPFVVDNTNVTRGARANYIEAARGGGFRVIGYYFRADVRAALRRNKLREGRERVPDKGVLGTLKRLEVPQLVEGFDELFYVWTSEENHFIVEPWGDGGPRSLP